MSNRIYFQLQYLNRLQFRAGRFSNALPNAKLWPLGAIPMTVKHLIFLISFLIEICNAQNYDSSFYSLIYSEIRSIQPTGTIYYADKPNSDIYSRFRKEVPQALKIYQKRKFRLNKYEQRQILSHIKNTANALNPNASFLNSICLPSDSIIQKVESIVKQESTKFRTILDNNKAANFYKTLPWAFFFGKPLYLRNHTLCLFYFMYFRSSSGEHGMRVYKLENEKWLRIGTIGEGAW